MRHHKWIALPLLTLAAAVLIAAPASAGKPTPACRTFSTKMQTTCPGKPALLEVGWIDGTVTGGVSLVYDDTAPPIDPQWSRPNLIISSKLGMLQMWVYSDSIPTKDGWWRVFKVMRVEGSGIYKEAALDLYMYGYYTNGAGGIYAMEGKLCSGRVSPPPVK
ncbi:MAG TPA: hypothetical protein VGS57_12305 [Thermoanaerobaculia bacterium]|jgi:hypothetical protein|nr:hypothetical protein [Thermoanaerobaculia bacterium]